MKIAMKRFSILSFLVLVSMNLWANPYEGFHWTFIDGKSTKVKYSTVVLETDTRRLIPVAKALHKAAVDIYSGEPSQTQEESYLAAFPKKFKVFLDVLHPKGLDQLYDGHIYIHILSKLSEKYPERVGEIFLSLSSEACLDADAPNHLRHELELFHKNHSRIYDDLYSKLSKKEKANLHLFLNASLHDMGAGTCRY
ncbi:hypothetical protein ACM66T_07510 [Sulfurimonas sp. ST-25]|uniref:hypothetical protein n=1 Tax=Sulfurimonas sp. ST-25 TaxID=3400151 RepID=UPI003A850A64